MGKDSAPEAPDPQEVAQAQAQANIATAREQYALAQKAAQESQRMAMSGQVTPYGSLQYVKDPTSPSGFRAITELSPEQQALLMQGQDLQAQYGGIAGEQLGRVGDRFAEDFDLSAARGTEISDMQRTFLDPQWDARSRQLEADLLNRGIRPGSEAYDIQMRQFNQQRDDAYNKMFLDAWTMANNAAMTERNIPMSDLASLGIGAAPQGVQMGGWVNTPGGTFSGPGVAPTDVTGPTYQSYNAQQNAHNQQMGGLYGLAGTGIQAAMMFSDRRVKTKVQKIGEDPRGWGVYLFEYVVDGLKELGMLIGYMADEVEKKRPDAVRVDPGSGMKMVDYGALAMA